MNDFLSALLIGTAIAVLAGAAAWNFLAITKSEDAA